MASNSWANPRDRSAPGLGQVVLPVLLDASEVGQQKDQVEQDHAQAQEAAQHAQGALEHVLHAGQELFRRRAQGVRRPGGGEQGLHVGPGREVLEPLPDVGGQVFLHPIGQARVRGDLLEHGPHGRKFGHDPGHHQPDHSHHERQDPGHGQEHGQPAILHQPLQRVGQGIEEVGQEQGGHKGHQGVGQEPEGPDRPGQEGQRQDHADHAVQGVRFVGFEHACLPAEGWFFSLLAGCGGLFNRIGPLATAGTRRARPRPGQPRGRPRPTAGPGTRTLPAGLPWGSSGRPAETGRPRRP